MKSDPQKIKVLAVRLQDRRVAVINRLAGDRHLFSFEQEYIDDPERPTLSLSFKGQTGGLVTSVHAVNLRLPPFFSNLLPEGHLRTYLAQRAGVKPEREFFLLAALGADLPGALTAMPLEEDEHADDRHADHDHHDDRRNDTALRFSLAGVQLKFSAIVEASGGLTVPADAAVDGFWQCQTLDLCLSHAPKHAVNGRNILKGSPGISKAGVRPLASRAVAVRS